MPSFGETIRNFTSGGQGVLFTTISIVIILFLVVLVLGLFYFFVYQRRKWNLKVEIKLIRSDGKLVNGEWGKGLYNQKKGVVLIKRPSAPKFSKPIAIKIFDPKRYMQGPDLITVIQIGPEDYRPVLNSSWTEHNVEYEDTDKPLKDKNGNALLDEKGDPLYETIEVKESILNIKTDVGTNKAWQNSWEESAKLAYTIRSILREYQTPIGIGIVVICCFVGFAVLWTKVGSCG